MYNQTPFCNRWKHWNTCFWFLVFWFSGLGFLNSQLHIRFMVLVFWSLLLSAQQSPAFLLIWYYSSWLTFLTRRLFDLFDWNLAGLKQQPPVWGSQILRLLIWSTLQAIIIWLKWGIFRLIYISRLSESIWGMYSSFTKERLETLIALDLGVMNISWWSNKY